jgi:molybdate transport system ATP-binding protein
VSVILRDISLTVGDFRLEVTAEVKGRVTALFGPSGAGKTSLLEVIAALRSPESAFIKVADQVLTDTSRALSVPTRRRGIGYVPQDLALFPHLSVLQNLLFGYHPARQGRFDFGELVELLEIGSLLSRGIAQLSGGEKQRVALGRALLASPRLLLLDEPLASLDLPLKRKIIPFLSRIRDELRIPMLYVTHDRFEALSLADEVVVLVNGKISQSGPTSEVFRRPANLEVARLLTTETVVPGRITKIVEGLALVDVGNVRITALDPTLPPGVDKVHVCINADDVILLRGPEDQPSSARNHLAATVSAIVPEGLLTRIELDCGFPLTALITRPACEELELRIGERVVGLVKAPSVHLIPR